MTDEWQRWFAWRPIRVLIYGGGSRLAWLRWVERRPGWQFGVPPLRCWFYREMAP